MTISPTAFLPLLAGAFSPTPMLPARLAEPRLMQPASTIGMQLEAGMGLSGLAQENLGQAAASMWPALDGVGPAAACALVALPCIVGARSHIAYGAAAYGAFAKAMPYVCSISTSTIKGVVSDLFAQLVVERRSRPQWRRTLAFAIFGALYLGFFAQFKYAVLYTSLFGATKTGPVIAAKLLADMIISAPLIYFPAYYTLKGVIHGTGARKEIRKYLSSHGMDMLTKYWVVWMPSLSVMWTVIPAHLRVPFICTISLAWQVALSTLTNNLPVEAATDGSRPALRRDQLDVVMKEDPSALAEAATYLRRCTRRPGVMRCIIR